MKQMKRLTALFLVLVMMFALAPAVFAADEFTDVSKSDWFYAPVNWAVNKGITGGIGNGMFGPNNDCTREQVVTFLWADAGKPEPTTTESPFTDVTESDWFFKPVMWAVENGVTSGVTPTEFGTGDTCTRAQVATFLWAVAGKPAIGQLTTGFLDVRSGDWYYNPVMWAVSQGITSGIGNGNFGPNNNCTRAQIATFMYAASDDYVKPEVTPAPAPTPVPAPTPGPVANEDRFEIAAAFVGNINSVEGVDMKILWRNNTGRDLADIAFYVSVLDYNGNVLRNQIGGGTEFHCYIMNPPFPSGEAEGGYYAGISKDTGRPDFPVLQYDEQLDRYYYHNFDVPYNSEGYKVYVSPADVNHTYNSTWWDAIMYNGRAQQIRINRVVLTYTDNTKETIRNPKVGPRTSPDADLEYTKNMYKEFTCEQAGHEAHPTCTASDVCKRCYAIIPALGHTYKYDETCTVCGERFSSELDLWVGNIPEPVVLKDRMGKDYTFTVTDVYLDDFFDVDVWVSNGVPEIRFYLELKFKYEGTSFSSLYDDLRVYVALRNEEGKIVSKYDFTAYTNDSRESFRVSAPKSGKYFIDVTLDCSEIGHDAAPTCTEDSVCTRCNQTFPAIGHRFGADSVCTVCGEGFELGLEFINTMTPGVQLDTPGRIDAVDGEGRAYTLYMNGIVVDETEEPVVVMENGRPVIKMHVNIPYRYETEDSDCEIPVYNVEVDFYSSEGELVLSEFFNTNLDETNKSLEITLPGNDTYYVETHAEIFSAVA